MVEILTKEFILMAGTVDVVSIAQKRHRADSRHPHGVGRLEHTVWGWLASVLPAPPTSQPEQCSPGVSQAYS